VQPRSPSTNVVRHGGPTTCRPVNRNATNLVAHVISPANAIGVCASPAWGAFPGRNGDLVVATGGGLQLVARDRCYEVDLLKPCSVWSSGAAGLLPERARNLVCRQHYRSAGCGYRRPLTGELRALPSA
jgi:hypothetical protein